MRKVELLPTWDCEGGYDPAFFFFFFKHTSIIKQRFQKIKTLLYQKQIMASPLNLMSLSDALYLEKETMKPVLCVFKLVLFPRKKRKMTFG